MISNARKKPASADERQTDLPPKAVESADQQPDEDALDQGVEESFPASDPVSVSITKIETDPD